MWRAYSPKNQQQPKESTMTTLASLVSTLVNKAESGKSVKRDLDTLTSAVAAIEAAKQSAIVARHAALVKRANDFAAANKLVKLPRRTRSANGSVLQTATTEAASIIEFLKTRSPAKKSEILAALNLKYFNFAIKIALKNGVTKHGTTTNSVSYSFIA